MLSAWKLSPRTELDVEPEAPASIDLPIEGAAALKAAVITVVLHYTAASPLA